MAVLRLAIALICLFFVTACEFNIQEYTMAIGGLSAKYESAKAGSTAIGYDTKGGTSYGTYQIASKTGTFNNFLNWLKSNGFKDVAQELSSAGAADTGSRSGGVPAAWKRLVNDGRLTRAMEHAFIQDTHYKPALDSLKDDNLKSLVESSPILQDVLWSTAVQHGAAGGAKIVNAAYKPGATPESLINSIYSKRTSAFKNNPYRAAATRRFVDERKDALAALSSGKMPSVPVSTGTIEEIPEYQESEVSPTQFEMPSFGEALATPFTIKPVQYTLPEIDGSLFAPVEQVPVEMEGAAPSPSTDNYFLDLLERRAPQRPQPLPDMPPLESPEPQPTMQAIVQAAGGLPIVQNGQPTFAIPETAAEARELRKFDPYDEMTRGSLVNLMQMLRQAETQRSGADKPMFSSYPTIFDDELLQLIDEV